MSKYIKPERKGQMIFIIMIILAIIIGIAWNMIEAEEQPQTWQTSYPMANAHISWEQTHYPGPWGGVNDGH